MKIIRAIKHTLPVIFWGLLIFGFDSSYTAILTIIAAVIHECGHLAVLFFFCKKKSSVPKATVYGFRINISELSYLQEAAVALGGPAVNFTVAAACLIVNGAAPLENYMHAFALLNLITMLSNLMPIESYDGYKAILSICAIICENPDRAEAVLRKISFAFSAVMSFFSLYLILKSGEGYWAFAVFFVSTLSSMFKEQKDMISKEFKSF